MPSVPLLRNDAVVLPLSLSLSSLSDFKGVARERAVISEEVGRRGEEYLEKLGKLPSRRLDLICGNAWTRGV